MLHIVGNNTIVQNLRIANTSGMPGTNSVGILIGQESNPTILNQIINCDVGGWGQNIVEHWTVQCAIKYCFLGNSFSNMVSIQNNVGGSTSDKILIENCDLNNGDSPVYGFPAMTAYQLTNVIAVQSDGSLGLMMTLNDGGDCAQYVVANNTYFTEISDNWEQAYMMNSNSCPMYFTNCNAITVIQDKFLNSNSNYIATFGLYGCNEQNCNFLGCVGTVLPPFYTTFDVAPNIYSSTLGLPNCNFTCWVVQHATYRDSTAPVLKPYGMTWMNSGGVSTNYTFTAGPTIYITNGVVGGLH
jgi:hypothetical protein